MLRLKFADKKPHALALQRIAIPSPSSCEDWLRSPEEASEMTGTILQSYLPADVQSVRHKQNMLGVRHRQPNQQIKRRVFHTALLH